MKFMDEHGFNKVEDFIGHSLQYFSTHAYLNELKQGKFEEKELAKDIQWSGEDIDKQTNNMASN
jgi:dihydropyrimidine dehydrogenase (NADP+)